MTRAWQTQGRSTRDRRRKKARPQRSPAPAARQVTPEQAETPRAPRPATSSVGWRSTPAARGGAMISIRPEDYHYIYSDLRRIAVMAAAIFAVLIILSFVIK